MKHLEKKDIWLFMAQAAVWATILFALPLATFISTSDVESTITSFWIVWGLFRAPLAIYFLNFYILGPYLFFRRRFWLFVLCNLVLIVGLNYQFFYVWYSRNNIPELTTMTTNMWIGFFSGFLMFLVLNCVVAAIAIGLRHFIRIRQLKQQLKEEKAKNTEAELAWLKNQINPHFLFNTLNNISSLTQIDPDAAQDAIAQLSDLLRYAMYETNKTTVPIEGEVTFMRNYIELMKLRCGDNTEVNYQFSILNHPLDPKGHLRSSSEQELEVAPLLFISLIENAFKHGVSSSRPSKIDIQLTQEGDSLVFTCDNTNYPKNDADRSGSGIGLENTRRRLELLYAGRYQWEQTLEGDIYHVEIKVKVKKSEY